MRRHPAFARLTLAALAVAAVTAAGPLAAQVAPPPPSAALAALPSVASLRTMAQAQQQPLLETLKALCEIESSSHDAEGLDRIASLIAERLKALGGDVRRVDVNPGAYRMADTPPRIGDAVQATWTGRGKASILLIAHMDTVYPRGTLARQPFRVDGDRAYGLGIADDKQGIAVILHVVQMLRQTGFDGFGKLTVLINGDEEISSPGTRNLLAELGAQHDVTMSFEGASADDAKLSLATAGIGAVTLDVRGKASHAGGAPERGINALMELSHQLMQTRDMADPANGVKFSWTLAKAGTVRNVIPETAQAQADVRVLRVADYDGLEAKLRERIRTQLLPDAKVTMNFERRRPPLEGSPAGQALARQAQAIYREMGLQLGYDSQVGGGGTDAAFAALRTRNAVVERFGLQGHGAHSNEDESVRLDSIAPRLVLATRLIMEVSAARAP